MENPAGDVSGLGLGIISSRPKNMGSRIYHCLLAAAFFILLILALSSLGNTAVTYNKVREDSVYG